MASEKKTQVPHTSIKKKTSQAYTNPKTSSMNKNKKRGYKKYRGQGR